MKKIMLIVLISLVLSAEVDIPSNKCALIVASRKTMSEVRDYVKDEISEKKYVTIYQANNGWYAIALGFLKNSEQKSIISRWKQINKIPHDSFCAKADKFSQEMDLNLKAYSSVIDKHKDTIQSMFDYSIVGDKVHLTVEVRNYYNKYKRGGLTISFPQFDDGYGSSKIKIKSSSGFKSKKYPKNSEIYNKESSSAMSSNYLMVEGWSDKWNGSSARRIKLIIDIKGKDTLVANIRVVVRKGNHTVAIPTVGPLDQQDYHVKRLVIDIPNSSKSQKTSVYHKYNSSNGNTNSTKGCSQSSKPILACSPSERDNKAFAMCAVSMGGCKIAVGLVDSTNERYVASQVCSAYSKELMGQKYTLNDMLGTFFVDAVNNYADEQLNSDDIWSQGFGFLLKVGTTGAKIQQFNQCINNAKRNCQSKYTEWQHNCN